MPEPVETKAMILVKAAPVLTSELQESMCVAAMRLGPQPDWIRLHPVPFRDLADDTKFRKYQEVTVQAIRPRNDRRPESWTPIEGSISATDRVRDKDALDVLRILRATETPDLARRVTRLGEHDLSAGVTTVAIEQLSPLFGTVDAVGVEMALRAAGLDADSEVLAAPLIALVADLLEAV